MKTICLVFFISVRAYDNIEFVHLFSGPVSVFLSCLFRQIFSSHVLLYISTIYHFILCRCSFFPLSYSPTGCYCVSECASIGSCKCDRRFVNGGTSLKKIITNNIHTKTRLSYRVFMWANETLTIENNWIWTLAAV